MRRVFALAGLAAGISVGFSCSFNLCLAQETKPATPAEKAPEPEKKNDGSDGKWDVSRIRPAMASREAGGVGRMSRSTPSEGTWMSVEHQPDGKSIVFDMLGDLYTMPIEGSSDGSKVKCIAEGLRVGHAAAVRPRRAVDRVCLRSHGRERQGGRQHLDHEARRHEPTPDHEGEFPPGDAAGVDAGFAVRGDWRGSFTSRRSLRRGRDVDVPHVQGKADGVQLTAKQSEQKDTGEPAGSSADGRYLYYSLDASAGGGFEYDKDSNPGIYAVDRLDMKTQVTERLIAGPGGACRPVPRPTGRAWRLCGVSYQTTLFVMDIESGRTRQVYSPLEHNNQETWAVHGVYPAMAWMPDGKSMVLWSKGKIRRVDMATGKDTVIPFRVKNSRKVADAIRFPIEVAPPAIRRQDDPERDGVAQRYRVVFRATGAPVHRELRRQGGRRAEAADRCDG